MIGALLIALALTAGIPQGNPAIEEKAREIETELIAPCCWTQQVSQHYSNVADQMRQEIRGMLTAGKTKQEILDFYVSRYGERVLAKPRARGFNLLVYVLPLVFLALGAGVVTVFLRRSRAQPATQEAAPTALGNGYDRRIAEELRDLDAQ